MARQFHDRHFPVRPNLEQLKHQAKDLLRALRSGDPEAIAALHKHHPKAVDPAAAKLADVQLVLACSYGLASWPRLVTACRMTDAIWRGDVDAVRELVLRDPRLIHEAARGLPDSNWGPPMSYAANVGQNAIIAMLREMGANDVQHAFERPCLQGKIETARQLYAMGARPTPEGLMGTCETLNDAGMAFLLELGAAFADEHGNRLGPIASLLETYSRYPKGKHRCLELAVAQGLELPDTPTMAMHRGRIDLLGRNLERNPDLLMRKFSLDQIYPPELGCHTDHSYSLHATPLDGTTLLHMSIDFDEIEIARWLVEHGADVNARAEIDTDGFGGHTPLFNCVVSQAYPCGRQRDAELARLLLEHGADPNQRASLRKMIRFVPDESLHEYRDVTPVAWGEQFHGQRYHDWVNKPAMELIREWGGHG
jgi:Ankyrin repeats (3 copies)